MENSLFKTGTPPVSLVGNFVFLSCFFSYPTPSIRSGGSLVPVLRILFDRLLVYGFLFGLFSSPI